MKQHRNYEQWSLDRGFIIPIIEDTFDYDVSGKQLCTIIDIFSFSMYVEMN